MSFNLFAPAPFPHYQFPQPICLAVQHYHDESPSCSNLLPKCLHRSPPPHAPPITQTITDGTLKLPLSSRRTHLNRMQKLFNLLLDLQFFCSHLFNIRRKVCKQFTFQQLQQHLKAEQLDRKTLQIIFCHLRNDFVVLGYLFLTSFEITPISDTFVINSAISRPIILYSNPNPNPTSNALPIPCADEPSVRRFTPERAVGPPRAKTNNSSNADFQSSPNTREAPVTILQNITSRISELEKAFTVAIASYTSIMRGFTLSISSCMIKCAGL